MATSLRTLLNKASVECLNESSQWPCSNALDNTNQYLYLESAEDAELLLQFAFHQPVRVERLAIGAAKLAGTAASGGFDLEHAPRSLGVFINRGHMGFDDAANETPAYSTELEPSHFDEKSLGVWVLPMPISKFRSVRSMALLFGDKPSSVHDDDDRKRLLVVVDLDETLFFSHLNPQSRHDFAVTVDKQDIFVSVRPGTKAFLQWCQEQRFNMGLYTSGTEAYAKALMKVVDPEGVLIEPANHRYRQSCWAVPYEIRVNDEKTVLQTLYAKDLALYGRDLSRVVLVDNSLFSFMLQPDNGIPISDWRGGDEKPIGDAETRVGGPERSARPSAARSLLPPEYPPFPQTAALAEAVREVNVSSVQPKTQSNAADEHSSEQTAASSQQTEGGPPSTDNGGVDDSSCAASSKAPSEYYYEEEAATFADFYPIRKTLEELAEAADVKPILREKYKIVDLIARRCISGMMQTGGGSE